MKLSEKRFYGILFLMLTWLYAAFLLTHPMNFFPLPFEEDVEEEGEDEEEDISYIPPLKRDESDGDIHK